MMDVRRQTQAQFAVCVGGEGWGVISGKLINAAEHEHTRWVLLRKKKDTDLPKCQTFFFFLNLTHQSCQAAIDKAFSRS